MKTCNILLLSRHNNARPASCEKDLWKRQFKAFINILVERVLYFRVCPANRCLRLRLFNVPCYFSALVGVSYSLSPPVFIQSLWKPFDPRHPFIIESRTMYTWPLPDKRYIDASWPSCLIVYCWHYPPSDPIINFFFLEITLFICFFIKFSCACVAIIVNIVINNMCVLIITSKYYVMISPPTFCTYPFFFIPAAHPPVSFFSFFNCLRCV